MKRVGRGGEGEGLSVEEKGMKKDPPVIHAGEKRRG